MFPLHLFIIIPLLMLLFLWLAKGVNAVRGVMVAGASALLISSITLVVMYLNARHAGATEDMLFTMDYTWFAPLHINYTVGVDGISVAMLLLSSIIVFTGTFASWRLKPLTKEYFLWFTLLSLGVFGFFVSIDLFMMFMFYEIALIPMYLLIGYWGTGHKEYSAMKLTLMLMGASALLMCGIFGIFYGAGGQTFNVLDLANHTNGAHAIPVGQQYIWFPPNFCGIRCAWCNVPVPHMESRRSCFCAYRSVHASRRSAYETRRLRMFPHSNVPHARGCTDSRLDIPDCDRHRRSIWRVLRLRSNRLEVHKRLLFGFPLRSCAFRHTHD